MSPSYQAHLIAKDADIELCVAKHYKGHQEPVAGPNGANALGPSFPSRDMPLSAGNEPIPPSADQDEGPGYMGCWIDDLAT